MSEFDIKENSQYRFHDLEKKLQSLENQNNQLKYDLDQKTQIISKVSKELSQIRAQYKQSVERIAELSSKKTRDNLNDDTIYTNQLKSQTKCIESLHDRLWENEYSNCLNNYNQYRNQRIYQNENIQKYLDYENHIDEIKYKSDKKINYYEKCIDQFKKEIKKWKAFAIRIFDICSDALETEPEFPKHDSKFQRQITVELVEQLAKQKADDTQVQRKYQLLQNKYNSLSQYLNKVKFQCNNLTEKTQNHLNIGPIDREGEISFIEEFVTQKNYHKEPASLRDVQKKKKTFTLDIDNEDYFIGDDKTETKNYSDQSNSSEFYSHSNHANHTASSFSSFDNSFESIKNLVKSFSREYKKEDRNRNHSKNSLRKRSKTSSIEDFSFESH